MAMLRFLFRRLMAQRLLALGVVLTLAFSVGVMAGTLTVIGLVLGPILGIAIGRVVWAEVASNIGVAGDLAVPWWLLGL